MRARSRVAQFLAGTVSAVILLAIVAGIPLVLLRLGSGLLPHHVPSLGSIRDGLLHKDVSGTLFMQVVVIIGWAAWASFALSVMVELVARFRGRSTVRIPGMRTQQRWAAALIAAIALMFVSPAIANAASVVGHRPAAAVAMATPSAAPAQHGQRVRNTPTAALADNTTRPVDGSQTLTYQVHRGDYLGNIAERFDGNFDAYHQIATANHITDPSHIEAGWKLQIPGSAVDRGTQPHAAGIVVGGAQTSPPTSTTPPVGAQTPTSGPVTPPPTRSSTTTPTTSPTKPATTVAASPSTVAKAAVGSNAHAAAPHVSNTQTSSQVDSAHSSGVVVEILEASGTLAGVVMLGMLAVSRREQLQRRLVKHVPAPATGGRLPRLMAPTQQADMIRVDSSLRSLAALVDGWPIERIPQIAGVWVDRGTVTLMLADDCGEAPLPFIDDPNGWTLPAGAVLVPHADQLAPLPTLVTVGGRTGQHLLLDIEYLRVLGIGGDPAESVNLLRFIAAELTHNVWSDDVRVVVAGFGDDSSALAAIDTDRVRVQASIPEAIVRFRRRVARSVANWDAPPGPPEVLLISRPSIEECDDLAALERDLMRAPGIGMAVVVGGTPEGFEASRYHVRVDADGLLRVGFLGDAVMPAASLPDLLVPEVASLIAAARTDGSASPLDLARAASQALLARASASNGVPGRGAPGKRAASLAGQHRRPPGQKPEPREAFVDLMKPRHVRSA